MTNLFIAEMTTDHFTFRAVAASKEAAVDAIIRGWKAHVKEYSEVTGRRTEGLKASDFTAPHELDEWYGINVYEMPLNDCMRDDTLLNVH